MTLVSRGTEAVAAYRRERVLEAWVDALARAATAQAEKAARGRDAGFSKRVRTKAISLQQRLWRAAGQGQNAL